MRICYSKRAIHGCTCDDKCEYDPNQKQAKASTGVVKWFSRVKGYGFIKPDDGGQEIFVHYNAIEGDGYRNLWEGEQVEFEIVDEGKGPKAARVVKGRREFR
jgi:CspA family cold shock protein